MARLVPSLVCLAQLLSLLVLVPSSEGQSEGAGSLEAPTASPLAFPRDHGKPVSPKSHSTPCSAIIEEKKEIVREDFDDAISLMLFGSIVWGMALLYMVNYRDADIRAFSYKMISTTITIFCAVVIMKIIDESGVSLFVLKGVGIREASAKVGSGAFGYILFLSALNVFCFEFRGSGIWLYAIKSLGAHLFAFAAIGVFAGIMLHRTSMSECLGVLCSASVLQAIVLALSMWTRRRLQSMVAGDPEDFMLVTQGGHPFWLEVVREAEDEATALMLSLLVNMTICFWLTGEMIPYEPEAKKDQAFVAAGLQGMAYWLLAFAVSVCVTTICKSIVKLNGVAERLLDILHNFLAMSMSWAMLRIGVDGTMRYFKHAVVGFLAHALTMSVCCVVVLICIDAVADHLFAQAVDEDLSDFDDEDEQDTGNVDDSVRREDASQVSRLAKFGRVVQSYKAREQALRAIIGALGIVIGLSWEMAFDCASSNLAESGSNMSQSVLSVNWLRRDLFKSALGAVVALLLVIPAWVRFIVPRARMHEREHQSNIDEELAHAERLFSHDRSCWTFIDTIKQSRRQSGQSATDSASDSL
mmetsp:Transcript_63617/g.183002  ORF Transcript_63617/g.183002 Transcript_63617/m.183002 type:complete len:584 (-) Transcript_63617:106-1857(-)